MWFDLRMTRQLFLHVGASKTGTSSLQTGVTDSLEALAAVGVGVPLARRGAKVSRLLEPLGWNGITGFTEPIDAPALDAGAQRVARTRGDRLLLSVEDLAEVREEHVAALVERLEDQHGLECHVVVTARDWSRQLPSEYQQQLKRRMTLDYETYLARVRDGEGEEAQQFRARQDVADVCARWAGRLAPDRVTVVPIDTRERSGIFDAFASLVGYPAGTVAEPARVVNQSFGLVESEVLRRFNLSLGDRMSDVRREYNPGVRRVLARGVLSRAGQVRITLPPAHLPWVQEAGRDQVRRIEELGARVHGDLDLLVADGSGAGELPPVTDEEIAQAAIDTFANFAVQSFSEQRRRQARAGRGADEPGR